MSENVKRQTSKVESHVFEVECIREDFPILKKQINGKPLVYLDNAASSQKPQVVIDAERHFYESQYANIHRGIYFLSEKATEAYEGVRSKVQEFINASDPREIVFVRSTTEAINLVASTYGRMLVNAGDEVLITGMEHHSNIVPWQILCNDVGAKLKIVPINDDGEISLDDFDRLMTERTRLVAVTHVSNALGTINPVKEIIAMAHDRNIPVVVDGAQAAPHMHLDMQELDCDFYAFSGHKIYGPTGVGVLYGKYDLLDQMPPYQGGGDMIQSVTFEETLYREPPYKFEAGTPNIAATIALGVAIDYVNSIGMESIVAYEEELHSHAMEVLSQIRELRFIGTAANKTGLVSFVIDGVHPHDIGTVLDEDGIAIRAGHHCAQPVMDRFGIPATVRASFAFYNTHEEIEVLVKGIRKVLEIFK
jgi:cysteine desulfurase/selenocysteine lyase